MEDFFRQLTELKVGNKLPTEVGRAFFSQISDNERRELLEKLLREQNYELIVAIVYCGYINAKSGVNSTSTDYISRKGGKVNIDSRYFELFSNLARECGINEIKLLPMYLACADSSKRSVLRVWQASALRQIRCLAADPEYAQTVRSFIRENDRNFVLAPLVVEVYGQSALNEYIELGVFGKGINKVALRNFLRSYDSEVLKYVTSSYDELKSAEKVAAVRLLLPQKNASEVSAFLRSVAESETSKSVLKLLSAPKMPSTRKGGRIEGGKVKTYFYDLMVSGNQIDVGDLIKNITKPEFSEVADQLFFSLYEGGVFRKLFVTDKGKILDLDGREFKLPLGAYVKVTHPVELTGATEHIKRWEIDQPFLQIRRKIYAPSEMDVRTSSYGEIVGTTVSAEKFTAGMRSLGFRVLSYGNGGVFDRVGLKRGGVWCVLTISPIDTLHKKEGSVQAQCVRFYGDKDVIKLGHSVIVDDVTPLALSGIDARTFSEFIYSVYKLMGCE